MRKLLIELFIGEKTYAKLVKYFSKRKKVQAKKKPVHDHMGHYTRMRQLRRENIEATFTSPEKQENDYSWLKGRDIIV